MQKLLNQLAIFTCLLPTNKAKVKLQPSYSQQIWQTVRKMINQRTRHFPLPRIQPHSSMGITGQKSSLKTKNQLSQTTEMWSI